MQRNSSAQDSGLERPAAERSRRTSSLPALLRLACLTGLAALVPPAARAVLEVSEVAPEPNQTGLARDPQITATFNEPLDPEFVTPHTFWTRGQRRGTIDGAFTFTLQDRKVTLDPFLTSSGRFGAGELIEVTLTRSLRGPTGNWLTVPYSWHFRCLSRPGTAQFSRQVTLHSGHGVVAVEAGHLNGDDRLDLATVRLGSEMETWINVSAPGDSVPSYEYHSYWFGGGHSSLILRDLTGDGILDVAVADQVSNRIHIGRNLGSGVEFEWTSFWTCDHPQRLVCGDLNGDGFDDLVYPCQYSGQLCVRLAAGDGAFSPPAHYPVGDWPIDADIRDLDRDGDLDVVVSNELSEEISILRNVDPTAAAVEMFEVLDSIPLEAPFGILVEDLNGDLYPDLVVATQDSARIAVFDMLPDCELAPPRYYGTGADPADKLRDVAPLDFDGDGDLDLAVSNADGNTWVLMENHGAGGFSPLATIPTGERPVQLSTADLNADGRVDVLVPCRIGGDVILHLSDADPTAVASPGAADPLLPRIEASPNPFRHRVTLTLEEDPGAALRVMDAAGRLVTERRARPMGGGRFGLTWDGRDAAGRVAPPGVYFVTAPGFQTQPLRLLRIQ